MAQRVITNIYHRVDAQAFEFEPKPNSAIAKALADGWVIAHISTAIHGTIHYTTFVVEKS